MLKGYFDDSGTHDESLVAAIGGFVAREEQWAQFEREWRDMLARYEIEFFRMADLESTQGQFFLWGREKKERLISEVCGQVHKWAKQAVSGLVIARDYEEAVPQWAKQTAAFGDAYNFCFQMCVGQVMEYVDRLDPPMPEGDQITFTFEQQSGHEGITRSNYTQIKSFRNPGDRMGAFGFDSKRGCLPLQLADFFAYESYKHLVNSVNESHRPIRAPLRILVEHGQDIQANYFDRSALESLVAHYDAMERPNHGNEPWWPWHPEPPLSVRSRI